MIDENLPLELEDVIPVLGQQQVTIIALRKEVERIKRENATLRDMTAKPDPEMDTAP